MKLTQQKLQDVLDYDPATGIFRWKVTTGRAVAGAPAGCVDDGYLRIKIHRVRYRAHRLAWLYMTGAWPDPEVDHRDGDGLNNKFANLRESNATQNNANKNLQRNNTSGFRGVTFFKPRNRWKMQISFNGKSTTKYFDTIEEAAASYATHAVEYFGVFAHPKHCATTLSALG